MEECVRERERVRWKLKLHIFTIVFIMHSISLHLLIMHFNECLCFHFNAVVLLLCFSSSPLHHSPLFIIHKHFFLYFEILAIIMLLIMRTIHQNFATYFEKLFPQNRELFRTNVIRKFFMYWILCNIFQSSSVSLLSSSSS
jgi:hypothetical protein